MTTDKARIELLEATLPHIAFDGWSLKSIQAGGRELGLEPVDAQNLFPGGVAELIETFSTHIDHQMMVSLEAQDLPAMKVRDRIAAAVRLRLELLEPHREAIRRGLTYLAMPQNAQLGLACLYRTVDAMWFAAGDRATDYNFYSKRLLLAGVYSSTLLFWLNDSSEGYSESWAFLDRRIGEVLKVGGRFGKAMSSVLSLPEKLLDRGKRLGKGDPLMKARGFATRGPGRRFGSSS